MFASTVSSIKRAFRAVIDYSERNRFIGITLLLLNLGLYYANLSNSSKACYNCDYPLITMIREVKESVDFIHSEISTASFSIEEMKEAMSDLSLGSRKLDNVTSILGHCTDVNEKVLVKLKKIGDDNMKLVVESTEDRGWLGALWHEFKKSLP